MSVSGRFTFIRGSLLWLREIGWFRMSEATNPLDAPDLPLLEGESPDLRQEAIATFGAAWLTRPNVRLGGAAPLEMIQKERGARVRDLIRTAKYIGVS